MTNRIFNQKENRKFALVTSKFTEKAYEDYKKKLFIGLQKYQSSAKTKYVYQLYDNDIVIPGIIIEENELFGFIYSSQYKLLKIAFNADICADFATDESSARLMWRISVRGKPVIYH